MIETYNKFQYSEFIGEKGQLVFRADTYEELMHQCLEAGIILPTKRVAVSQPQVQQIAQPTPEQVSAPAEKSLGRCSKCGADMVHNPKTGKNFCKLKCWLKQA